MHNYRQAALCLHGLGHADRQWLLSRLPDRHRDTLRTLLDELESLGIPGDRDFREYAQDTPQAGGHPAADLLAADVLEVEAALPEQIWIILESESDTVVKAVLAARNWSWQSDVVARFRKSYRNIGLPERTLTGKVHAALITALAARLRRQQGKPPLSQRSSWNKRLRRVLWQR